MLKILIHASGVACFGYSLYYDLNYVRLPPHLAANPLFASAQAFPGKWKYLTVWDMVLQFVYHSVSLLNDLGGSSEITARKQSALQKLRDGLFGSWAFPIGLFVSVTFWGLYAIDRALVFPKEFDEFYPNWLNHAVHTGPIAFMALELLTTPKLFPSGRAALMGNIGFSVTYLSWITWVYSQTGYWAYPVLTILNNYQRALFFLSNGLSILAFYFLGEKVSNWKWAGGSSEMAKKKKKGKFN